MARAEDRVEFAAAAAADVDRIHAWLEQHRSAVVAQRWWSKLDRAVTSLRWFPRRCGMAPENHEGREIRHVMFGKQTGTYRILFTVSEESRRVLILHVRHGRMRLLPPHRDAGEAVVD